MSAPYQLGRNAIVTAGILFAGTSAAVWFVLDQIRVCLNGDYVMFGLHCQYYPGFELLWLLPFMVAAAYWFGRTKAKAPRIMLWAAVLVVIALAVVWAIATIS